MSDTRLKFDPNGRNVIGAIDDSTGDIVPLYADNATGRLKVDAEVTISGLPTAISDGDAVNAANDGTIVLGTDGSNYQVLSVDSSGRLILGASSLAIGKLVPMDQDTTANSNHADKYYTNAGAVTDGIIWSPAAGKRWHILTLYINVSAAATVTIEDDLAGGDVVRWKGELAANSGVVLRYDRDHPFASTEDAADLIITTSTGNVYVQAVGYEI